MLVRPIPLDIVMLFMVCVYLMVILGTKGDGEVYLTGSLMKIHCKQVVSNKLKGSVTYSIIKETPNEDPAVRPILEYTTPNYRFPPPRAK